MDPLYPGLIVLAPTIAADLGPNYTHVVALPGAASTAAQQIFPSPTAFAQAQGSYIRVFSTVAAHIGFGPSTLAAATANDWPLNANSPQEFFCWANPGANPRDYFRAYSLLAGTLYWYLG